MTDDKKQKLLVIVPAHNEEQMLETNITLLRHYLAKNSKMDFSIVISNNNSTDRTLDIANELAKRFPEVKYISVMDKGKGITVKTAQQNFKSDWYCFIDCDLPVPVESFKAMESTILEDKYDLIIGNRHSEGGNLKGSFKRKLISQGYLALVKLILFNSKIKDVQTGFKAWNNSIKSEVFPLVTDKHWCFDTELVYYAYKQKKNVGYLPVDYALETGRKSGLNLIKDSFKFFKNLVKLRAKNLFR